MCYNIEFTPVFNCALWPTSREKCVSWKFCEAEDASVYTRRIVQFAIDSILTIFCAWALRTRSVVTLGDGIKNTETALTHRPNSHHLC